MLLVFGCHDYGNGGCGYGSHTGIDAATLLVVAWHVLNIL
jgi:hypothetical protein